ncbi:MAG: BatA domain-containing protein [Phycisphaeraceae bacterium]
MNFLTGAFLFGMVAAAGPTLIHLLNRRRHRTVHWAAMDFLRDAIRRNKRIMELRDIVLLLLRTLAITLFVLAMAQPFVQSNGLWWTVVAGFVIAMVGVGAMIFGSIAQRKSGIVTGTALLAVGIGLFVLSILQHDQAVTASYSGEPVHAVIVIDNSLSMGYVELDKSLLEVSKEKVRQYLQALPRGSDISIIPLCNQQEWHLRNVDSTQDDALDTLASVELVDREARAADGADAARIALKEASLIKTKRVVFLSDMQRKSWTPEAVRKSFEGLGPVQLVQVAPESKGRRSNSWVSEFVLSDGVADTQAQAIFVGTIRHSGPEPRSKVRATLRIDNQVIDHRDIDLEDGATVRVTFRYKFEAGGTSSDPVFVPARLEIDAKEPLVADNYRELLVPVVSEVPVLFIDQYGQREQPRLNQYGETLRLRHLLTRRGHRETGNEKSLVEVRHRSPELVTRDDLKDARIVVMAGVTSPTPELVTLLREYVEQGGQVFLAAGAEFDPRSWNTFGWLDGKGILPAPLNDQPVGRVPPSNATSTGDYPTFGLATNSIRSEVLNPQIDPTDQRDLLAGPFFFKAVSVDETAIEGFLKEERKRIEAQVTFVRGHEANEQRWTQLERDGKLTATQATDRDASRKRFAEMFPSWLSWSTPLPPGHGDETIDEIVNRSRPRILGNYDNDNGDVFALRRDIGRGRVVMLTTGVFPLWNNMSEEPGTVLLMEHVLLTMLKRSLPQRTFEAVNAIDVPIDLRDQAARFELLAPGAESAVSVRVDPMGENAYGVQLRSLGRRGVYELKRLSSPGEEAGIAREWTTLLAVNGPGDESELASYEQAEFLAELALPRIKWLPLSQPISLEGEVYIGTNLWKMLMWGVIGCLIIEMLFLSAPSVKEKLASAAAARSGESTAT